MFFDDYRIYRRRNSRFIFFYCLIYQDNHLKKNEKTFKNLFNNDLTFEFVYFIERIFEDLFNNDFTFEFIHFNETIIFDMKSSIL